ncbi:EAL domain-containing protein [Sinimarinibacterium sp. CAU 1509]|nr:EAL domain-containing protein [Sinimarinibacterium sp. CAU 1509]
MVVSHPQGDRDGESLLDFSRRYADADGRFAGVVTVSVHAGYFVSSYEARVFGKRGVLGLLGTDGVFRALRSGDTLSSGLATDYAALVSDDADEGTAEVRLHGWDNTRRYSIARKLFEFPLAIVVGLAEAEQHAAAADLRRRYLRRAGAVSALLLAVMALLGGLSWRLQQARARAQDERIEHARRLEHLAFHDNLTDLPNRAHFSHLLIQGMQQARRYERKLALLFLDLDHFKVINDSLGHEAGDELLQEIGRRLHGSVRASDIVARLSGDEFVVLLPEIDTPDQVVPVAEKILAAVARPFTLAGQEISVTVSVGVTLFPDDGDDEQTLMKSADVAMYHAKEQGKNNFRFFSQALSTDSLERLTLEASLRNALERGEFRLCYQARRSMSDGRITGMEALVHWQHPELGLLPPCKFVPLAEELGLILALGRWALTSACRQNVAWQREGFPPLGMAVKLSERQFIDESLVKNMASALNDSGMDPQLLEVEITEGVVIRDIQQTIRTLTDLKRLGVRVAINDFGAGYSSLSNLQQYPIDMIRIHRSFIRDRGRNPDPSGLAAALIKLGRSLSLTVIAEVEPEAQADFLRTQLRDEFQGYYTHQPMSAEDFAQLMRQQLAAEDRPRTD